MTCSGQDYRRVLTTGKKSAIVVVAEGDHPGHTFAIAEEAKDKLKIESRVVFWAMSSAAVRQRRAIEYWPVISVLPQSRLWWMGKNVAWLARLSVK